MCFKSTIQHILRRRGRRVRLRRHHSMGGMMCGNLDLLHHVRRSLTRMPTGQGYKETEPKTRSGRRGIALVPFAVEALKQHWELQQVERAKAGELWQDHDYGFCKADGSHLNPGRDVYEQFKAVLKKAGLPAVRFHDLRHSAATILLAMNVHPKVIQELLGHNQISMTMDLYSHVLPGLQDEVIDRLEDVLERSEDNEDDQGTGVPVG